MKRDEMDILAAEYVLGTMEPEARARLRRRFMKEPALCRSVEAWEARLSGLSAEETPLEPSSGVWDRIDAALDREPDEAPPLDFSITVRRDEGDWQVVVEGVYKKRLFVDRKAGYEAFLMRLDPGACIPAHPHGITEECIMLEGEVSVGDMHLKAGDFHIISAGSVHPEITSETGGLFYVRGQVRAA